MSLEVTGIPEMLQRLQRLQQPRAHVLMEALRDEGNQIMRQSVALVPVETGLLRSTAAVEQPVQIGPIVSVTLRYGGYGMAPYAAVQEFDVTLNHPQGQAHFLQQPLFEAAPGFPHRMAAAITAALRQP